MSRLDQVTELYGNLNYMQHDEAVLMKKLITKHELSRILEIGFYHGKSSAYLAAILEDVGEGHLITIDRDTAKRRQPNISQVLAELRLEHRVTPIYAERSYTWELAKLIRDKEHIRFDLCYFDGGHTWDATGFGFVLIDMLLRPGGWIVFDDLDWTIENAMPGMKKVPKHWLACGADERAAPAVRMVFETLVPHLGYTDQQTINNGRWGIARKPALDAAQHATTGALDKLRQLLAR